MQQATRRRSEPEGTAQQAPPAPQGDRAKTAAKEQSVAARACHALYSDHKTGDTPVFQQQVDQCVTDTGRSNGSYVVSEQSRKPDGNSYGHSLPNKACSKSQTAYARAAANLQAASAGACAAATPGEEPADPAQCPLTLERDDQLYQSAAHVHTPGPVRPAASRCTQPTDPERAQQRPQHLPVKQRHQCHHHQAK